MKIEGLVDVFAGLRPNATLLSVKQYTNNWNEISSFGIVFHIDYEEALKRSYKKISTYIATDILHKEAKRLVLSSLTDRMDAFRIPLEQRDHPYVYFKDANGQYIKGIKAHQETGNLYLYGLLVSKKILVPAKYDPTNSSQLTLAKNRIESGTPVSKFRLFKLMPKSYKEIKVENLTIK